jgi:hypothetical protein
VSSLRDRFLSRVHAKGVGTAIPSGNISPTASLQAGYRALDIAYQHGVARDRGKVLEWLDRAFRDKDGGLDLCRNAPEFDFVRSDPRLADLVHRMGLPQ